MKEIQKPSDNLGGLLKMWAIPKAVFSINGKAITFSDTSDIYSIYCTAETLSLKETPKETNSRNHYVTDVSGFIPNNNESVHSAIVDMEGKSYVVLIQDGNGYYQLVGESQYPLRIKANSISGKSVSDRSGYQINFVGKTINRGVFVNYPF
jgi:hypothetical protein